MSNENPTRKPTRDEIMEAIKRCAAKLGHAPTHTEMMQELDVPIKHYQRLFGSYTQALKDCGLDPEGCGYELSMDKLFHEWARIVRELGKVPSVNEFELRSKYSLMTLRRRFVSWTNVPAGLMHYAKDKGLEEQFRDVMDIAKRYCERGSRRGCKYTPEAESISRPKILDDRPVYGESLVGLPMAYAPTNEQGVLILFGALAMKLGFTILWVGTAYPDSEAVRQVEPGKWQRVRIEFEYQSRNFVAHFHDVRKCDMIVCWEHNWPECPVEVVELKKALSIQQSAFSPDASR